MIGHRPLLKRNWNMRRLFFRKNYLWMALTHQRYLSFYFIFFSSNQIPLPNLQIRIYFNSNFLQLKSTDGLFQLFRRFGTIENIEILREKFPSDENPDECYAYDTYADAMDAARCYKGRDAMEGLKIVPANTWKQPAFIEKHQRGLDESVLQELNDDCLRHIFDYCGSQTFINLCRFSDRFSSIIVCGRFFRTQEVRN